MIYNDFIIIILINHDNHYKSASYPSTFFLQIKVAPILQFVLSFYKKLTFIPKTQNLNDSPTQ